jgi:hypothetical protein
MGSMSEDEIPKEELEVIDRVVGAFNFIRVRMAMRPLDWRWVGEGLPSVGSMKAVARQLLVDAARDAHREVHGALVAKGYRATGGFLATCAIRPTGEADFELLFYVDKCFGSTGDE